MFRTSFISTLVAASFALLPLGTAQATDTMTEWSAKVRNEIVENNYYPQSAINRGIEGKVKVRFEVSGSGLVKGVQITETSGSDILDAEAMRLALRVAKLPSLPEGLNQHSFVVPITFKLAEASKQGEKTKAVAENMDLKIRLG
ncbi:energy transducer TonB [Kordiimonas pumila]|uniref:Energy transducer TonB n=1 Tax=Kordiimonas pumila TaxID=2161677 RepID=A0ABV7D746_9PROT|nr:energy transducer TonB [Kordiimonas pumila]